eukprot:CAMPEP_0198577626 /NCGR_PEP_ID=MMETSP1462-20131121/119160_1 /TAXON_ID=1333877 /ORGANISM="Brandtodinium nutriculum, Strain RCC3387" /LENGTH=115 /DNA_ID=CAMNT_0044308909 /DNA_START=117 /DNA_END=460 /DNA_ORIENTATION=-
MLLRRANIPGHQPQGRAQRGSSLLHVHAAGVQLLPVGRRAAAAACEGRRLHVRRAERPADRPEGGPEQGPRVLHVFEEGLRVLPVGRRGAPEDRAGPRLRDLLRADVQKDRTQGR